jgi:hypothetical protein
MMNTKRPTTWLLLLLLLLLALVSPLGSSAFVGGEVIPGTEQILQGTSGQYIDIAGRVDAAANSFVAIATHDPANNNNTWIEIRRYSPAGAITWYDEARPKLPNYKIENISLEYSGSTLIVQMTVHTFGAGPRIRRAEQAPFAGVFTYRAGMEVEEGAPGVFQPQAPTVEIDYAKVRQQVHDELVSMGVVTERMFDGSTGSFKVYSQLLNTSYSGALEACKR